MLDVAFQGKDEDVINPASLFKSDDFQEKATVAKLDISAFASKALSKAVLSLGCPLIVAKVVVIL